MCFNRNVEIGFPEELFEPGNVPQYLSVVAGNLFGLGALKKVRLQDVIFPDGLLSAHKGPRFGIEDARKILGVYDRPLVGTIVKPKVGLDPAATAAVAAAAVRGGLDLVKDDETLTNQSFCPFGGLPRGLGRSISCQSLWKFGWLRHRLHHPGRRRSAWPSGWNRSWSQGDGPGSGGMARANSSQRICKRPQRVGNSPEILGIISGKNGIGDIAQEQNRRVYIGR
jgi:hypothetical protein